MGAGRLYQESWRLEPYLARWKEV